MIRLRFLLYILINLLCMPINAYWQALPEDPVEKEYSTGSDFFDDDYDEDLFGQEMLEMTLNSEQTNVFRATPESIIAILEGIDALQILQESFYLHTNPIVSRDLVDEPFEPLICKPQRHWFVGFFNFWNQTNHSYLTQHSTHMNSYLALYEPSLIDKLENTASNLNQLFDEPQFNLNVQEIFGLFSPMTVQERRIGLMLYAQGWFEKLAFRLYTPLYYRERNFFLNNEQRKALEIQFGELEPQQQKAFQKQHLISDKFGLGDTRFEIDFPVVRHWSSEIKLGFLLTIPTGGSFVKGMAGSSFEKDKNAAMPTFDFNGLFNLSEGTITEETKQQAFSILSNFLLGALDRLSANLLDVPLGNGRHLGLGISARTITYGGNYHPWAENIAFHTHTYVEYLFPSSEKRFFTKKINPSDFESRDFNDPNAANSNLTFIEQEFVDRLYTLAFDTLVQPGVIIRTRGRLCYCGSWVDVGFGADFWLQSRDYLLHIQGPESLVMQLDKKKAQPLTAYQADLFGNISFKVRHGRDYFWVVGLNGSGTYAQSGIGREFLVALHIAAHF